jgi:hypothetical protein
MDLDRTASSDASQKTLAADETVVERQGREGGEREPREDQAEGGASLFSSFRENAAMAMAMEEGEM